MDSVVLASNKPSLRDWLQTNNIQFNKINVRPWGSYELSISTDGGASWIHIQRVDGLGGNEIQAFEWLLTDNLHDDNFRRSLDQLFGEEKTTELLSLYNDEKIN